MSIVNYGVALIIAVGAAYGIGRHNGYEIRAAEDEAVIAQKNQEMNEAKEKADAELYQAKQRLPSIWPLLQNRGDCTVQLSIWTLNPVPSAGMISAGKRALSLFHPTRRGCRISFKQPEKTVPVWSFLIRRLIPKR